MIRAVSRVSGVALISLVLVVSSFLVGNFALSEGTGPFKPISLIDVDGKPEAGFAAQAQEWFAEQFGIIIRREYAFADGLIWLCVALAAWNSLKDKARLSVEVKMEVEIGGYVRPHFYKKLKRPRTYLPAKRHPGYLPQVSSAAVSMPRG